MRKLILVGLNEINFEFIDRYIEQGYLPTFEKLFKEHGYGETTSESTYELLEPWIQWVTVHTGKNFAEHQVFRLGDIVNTSHKQIWEIAEEQGLTVGAVSPFNAKNALKTPAFFIPDPWTATKISGNDSVKAVSEAVGSAVNNNASGGVTPGTMWKLIRGFMTFVPVSEYGKYISLLGRLRKKATKAALLDNVLADTFISLWKKNKPDFSSLFLNSCAHVQHHYMFNSKVYSGDQKNPEWYINRKDDPILDMLKQYDKILARLLKLDSRIIICTGLHQKPHTKNTYYWRLKNHEQFLQFVGISFESVLPRMSRDFLIKFADSQQATEAEANLLSLELNGQKIFHVDNRGTSLFVELVYSKDIPVNSLIQVPKTETVDLHQYVAFVAIKNGEHDGIGYFLDTAKKSDGERIALKQVFDRLIEALPVKKRHSAA